MSLTPLVALLPFLPRERPFGSVSSRRGPPVLRHRILWAAAGGSTLAGAGTRLEAHG